jgi:hypothetical protein
MKTHIPICLTAYLRTAGYFLLAIVGLLNMPLAVVQAAPVTAGLVYNFDAAASGATGTTWTSTAPGSNTTRQWTIAGTGIVYNTGDRSPSTSLTRAYHFSGGGGAYTSCFTDITGNWTLEIWFKPDGLAGGNQIVFEDGGLGTGRAVIIADNVVYVTVKSSNDGAAPMIVATHPLNEKDASDFIQVVLTSDTAAGFKAYINALGDVAPELPKSTAVYINAAYGGTGDGAGLGDRRYSPGSLSNTGGSPWNQGLFKAYEGDIALLRLYNRVLSGAEVKQNYLAATLRDPVGGTPITRWAEWGPAIGRGGLSPFCDEGKLRPQPGDISNSGGFDVKMIEWRDVTLAANGLADFMDATRFPRVTSERNRSNAFSDYGSVEYLHTYLKASDTASTSVVLDVDSKTPLFYLWLNGQPIVRGKVVTLTPGWNRLMVRSLSPAINYYYYGTPKSPNWPTTGSGWYIKVQLTQPTGGAVPGVVYQTFDPQRKVLVTTESPARNFRYYTTLRRHSIEEDAAVFEKGEFIIVDYKVQVALGTDANYKAPVDRISHMHGLNWIYSFDPDRVSRNVPNVGQPWTAVSAASFNSFAPNRERVGHHHLHAHLWCGSKRCGDGRRQFDQLWCSVARSLPSDVRPA